MYYVYLTLLSLAFLVIECLVGGTRLIYSLPSYSILGVAALLSIFSIRSAKIPARPACLLASALFFGYILARAYASPVEYLARVDIMMVLGCLAIYFLTALHFTRSKYRMYFLAVLLVVALAQVIVGLIQFARGEDYMLFGFHRYTIGNRASGQYVSPNHLAGYLEVVGIIGLSLVVWSKWKPWAKILTAYVALVAFGGVAITGSRGGYVSAIVCILAFFLLGIIVIKIAFPERFTRILTLGAILVLGTCMVVAFAAQRSDLVKSRAVAVFSKDMRLLMWKAAWRQVQLDPLVGTGSGTYLYYGRKFRDPDVQLDPIRVHNDYLDLLAEYGIAGAVGFLIFLGCHLWSGLHTFFWLVRKRLQFAGDWRSGSLALNIGALCAVAAYLVHSVVDFNLHIPANAMLMAFVFGMLANPGQETFQGKSLARNTNRVFQFLLPALGVLLLVLALPRIPGEYYAEKARAALRDKRYTESVQAANEGIAREKNNPNLYYCLGEATRKIGDHFPAPLGVSFYRKASEAFKKGLALAPHDVPLLLIEGWTLDALEQHEEAGQYFQQALEWDPNGTQAQESNASHLNFIKPVAKPNL